MENSKRYAVYYAPPAGAFAERAAAWLGRDAVSDAPVAHPDLGVDLAAVTAEPRRYGFHGTLKPPFRLAAGQTRGALHLELDLLARRKQQVTLKGLQLLPIAGFLALVPEGPCDALEDLAASIVTELDMFRAPLNERELARRKPESLTPRQRHLLDLWGYPYVLEEFRFHLTLTDRLDPRRQAEMAQAAEEWFRPVLPQPFTISELCLFEEHEDGRFQLLHRYPLSV